MKPQMLMSENDLAAPTREELLKLMADLRVAVESDPTLERRFMLQMARYVFHVVGDWKQKVDDSDRFTCAKVETMENHVTAIYNQTQAELENVRNSITLCLKMANHFFPAKECERCKKGADVGSAKTPEAA